MNNRKLLIEKLRDRRAIIGVVGLGYVGLPLALTYAEAGFKVLGFDVDPAKVRSIAAAKSYFNHIPDERLSAVEGQFSATTDFSRAAEVDALIICMPTPLTANREPDLQFVTSAMEGVLPNLHSGQVLSLESTTWPGTTREVVAPLIEQSGFNIGEDIFLVYSPEREDPGNETFDMSIIPKVCAGLTSSCLEVGRVLYGEVVDSVVPVSSTEVAEMTKLLENIHRAVNIGLVNEMKQVAEVMGIDIVEVIEAAATKPFGFTPYYPGPGLGGHCIPIDPFYLTWRARQFGVDTRLVELAGEINSAMPERVVQKTEQALREAGLSLSASRILILGVAYKRNVSDTRESPAMPIIESLELRGGEVAYSDPHVPKMPKMARYNFTHESVELTAETLQSFDCVVLVTDHDDFEYPLIDQHARLLVDTRSRFRGSHRPITKA